VQAVLSALLESLVEEHEDRVVLGGTANLARVGPDFPLTIRPVLEALEEQMVLLRLLGEARDQSAVTVRIGRENPHEALTSTSVVSVGYGSEGETLAKLGVLGPTRMDYPGTMGAVRAVARYVGRIVGDG
jgi:heat-inducible transcriptional repressor